MEGPKNEDLMISDDNTFEVQAIHQQSIIVGDHEKDAEKEQGSLLLNFLTQKVKDHFL